eukprot:SAG31_NODE_3691_length_3985_cov_3.675244_1_plen_35_part_10
MGARKYPTSFVALVVAIYVSVVGSHGMACPTNKIS